MQFRVNEISHGSGASEDRTERVVWTSTDESVATVSRSGLVTATGKGSATIMATLTNENKTAVAAAAKFTVTGAAQQQRFESVSRRQFSDPIEIKRKKKPLAWSALLTLDQADSISPDRPPCCVSTL